MLSKPRSGGIVAAASKEGQKNISPGGHYGCRSRCKTGHIAFEDLIIGWSWQIKLESW